MIKDAEVIAVFGRRGSGKSTRVKNLLRDQHRVVVFDNVREYGAEGFHVVESLIELREAMADGWSHGFRLAYVPGRAGRLEAFERVAELLLTAQRPYFDSLDSREIMFVVEEVNLVYPNRPNASPAFTECILQGRHYGINLIGVTQRPTLLSPNFRGNARKWDVFPLEYHDDRAEVLKKIGPDWAVALRNLQNHNYFSIRDGEVSEGSNPPLNG